MDEFETYANAVAILNDEMAAMARTLTAERPDPDTAVHLRKRIYEAMNGLSATTFALMDAKARGISADPEMYRHVG